jgi:hypothetical protein
MPWRSGDGTCKLAGIKINAFVSNLLLSGINIRILGIPKNYWSRILITWRSPPFRSKTLGRFWLVEPQPRACSFGWWLMAGAGLLWEKSTADWLMVAGLFWEKSTVGWWLISQANMALLASGVPVLASGSSILPDPDLARFGTLSTLSNKSASHDLAMQGVGRLSRLRERGASVGLR